MGFGPGDILSLIWSHPIASVIVALLFTPPLFPIVVFFSPLLISTALVVLAMVSMGSEVDETPSNYGSDSHYKRGWREQDYDDGRVFDDDEVKKSPKRLKSSAQEDGWLNKVKSWEETGRAWVESVLHQEGWKASPNSSGGAGETLPHTIDRQNEILSVVSNISQSIKQTSDASSKVSDSKSESISKPLDSASDVTHRGVASSSDAPRVKPESSRKMSEITSEPEPEEDLIELTPRDMHGLPPSANSTSKGKEKVEDLHPEDNRTQVKWDEELPVSGDGTSGVFDPSKESAIDSAFGAAPKTDTDAAVEPDASGEKTSHGAGEAPPASAAVRDRRVENIAVKSGSAEATGDSSVTAEHSSSHPAAKAIRERRVEHQRTPSVAVELSEKLNVPLEDLMSLLAGDKASTSGEVPVGKGVSSSETTTSQEEEWSSSDDESSQAAPKADEIQQPDRKN